ncbi:hypothetical protein [Arenimonas oryziterrae]|uniref:hypothetical protein n=1 Tax=Arenimonas oryziterrae TaxID=498055 RepID=UPI0012DD5B4F|nr:hypothetical protein [Arenimonas oryziterrae]
MLATVVALTVLCAPPTLRAADDISATAVESRQATRCAVFYLLMAKIPALSNESARFNALVDRLGAIAVRNAATGEDIDRWAKEFMTEATTNAQLPASTFNQDQSGLCQSFLDSHAATAPVPATAVAPVAPATASTNGVVDRHPDGRPATIATGGQRVSFDTGRGASCDAPVGMTNAENREARIRSQYVWLDDVSPGWKLVSRATRYSEPPNEANIDRVRIYSWFSLTDNAGKPFEVCFDTTQGMLPTLKALTR